MAIPQPIPSLSLDLLHSDIPNCGFTLTIPPNISITLTAFLPQHLLCVHIEISTPLIILISFYFHPSFSHFLSNHTLGSSLQSFSCQDLPSPLYLSFTTTHTSEHPLHQTDQSGCLPSPNAVGHNYRILLVGPPETHGSWPELGAQLCMERSCFPLSAPLCSSRKLTHTFFSLFKPYVQICFSSPLGVDLASTELRK